MFRCLLFLGLFLSLQHTAFAWWNEDWSFRKVITIDTTATGLEIGEPVSDVTALVRLHTGNFGYFFDIREGGADLRFMAADDMTPLRHHVEMLDPINEIALFWVKIPQLNAGVSDKIYMYYGNQAAITAVDVPGTFDEAEVLALHFDEAATPRDKTYNGNHPVAGTVEINKASLMGQGARFDGMSSLVFPETLTMSLSPETGWTFSAWVKPDAEAADTVLFEIGQPGNAISIVQQGDALLASYTDGTTTVDTQLTQPLIIGDWQHVALVVAGTQMTLYVNGQDAVATDIPPLSLSGQVSIGMAVDNAGSALTEAAETAAAEAATNEETVAASVVNGFVGEMDEVRMAAVARSATYLRVVANNQGKSSRLLVYGGDETQETEGSAEAEGHGGYFGIIINNVFGNDEAIVEQIVIGFCGFMAIVAFLIMFFKAATIFGAKSASRRFLKAYENLGTDAEQFDELFEADRKYGNSPLFRVYKQGIIELRKRMSPAVGSDFAGLEMKSVNAIKSSLDATMVRESQRINSYIVMLTIAISGGPFVGLLGTVVGVMVTFAGIAAAGEVNINAIAPGMAAALLATVAGLGVAIPALFGYNYLGSHIRELNADMHVFTDEFIARMNESFGH